MNLPIGAHDFPYLYSQAASSLFNLPLTWEPKSHDALGVFALSTLWDWPYGLLYGLAAKIGLNFTLSTLIFGILPPFIVGWFTMGQLLKSYSLSRQARLIGQLLFVANTYLLMLIDGGQLSLAVGYALLPGVMFLLPCRSKFILTLAIVSFLDIRYLFLLAIPLALKAIFDFRKIGYHIVTAFIAGLVLAGLHSYWLLPAILTKGPSLPPTHTRPLQVQALNFTTLAHSLFLIHPHWPRNVFGQASGVLPQFALLPVLAFLPLLFFRKNSTVAYWTSLALLSAFLVKGTNPPLGPVYQWLFTHLPGFNLFRDSTKFFSLLVMAYSVLIAISAHFIASRHKSGFFLMFFYLISLVTPVFWGKTTGLFSRPRHEDSYLQLASYVNTDSSPGSLLWIPSKPPLGYSSPTHPSLDALTLLDKQPFSAGVVGNYELLNFLRDGAGTGQLLNIASVKYLGLPALDPKTDSLKPEDVAYHALFTDQLASRPWVASRRNFGPVTLLTTHSHQSTVFIPSQTFFVIGSADNYSPQTGMVFVESQPQLLARISDYPQARVLLNHKTLIDVAASLTPPRNFLFPADLLDFSPNSTGWWKRETADIISWRDFLERKYQLTTQDFDYGGGLAVSEGIHRLTVYPRPCQPDCLLLARLMTSPRGGLITFSSSSGPIGAISTASSTRKITRTLAGQSLSYSQADLSWFEIGPWPTSQALTLTTQGDLNVVNALVTLPKATWSQFQSQANTLLARPASTPFPSPQVAYTRHNSTHYSLLITHLTSPTTLAFSQNFDSFWRLNNTSPVPLYGFINGFPVTHNGYYDLHFLPQAYVLPGLAICLLTLVILIVSWILKPLFAPGHSNNPQSPS